MALIEFLVRLKWFKSSLYSFFIGLLAASDFYLLDSFPDVFFRWVLITELLLKQFGMKDIFERPECYLCEVDDFADKIENFLF